MNRKSRSLIFFLLTALFIVQTVAASTPDKESKNQRLKIGDELQLQLASPAYEVSAAEKGLVWREELYVPNASYISVHFSHFALPKGAELVLRTPDDAREVRYTGFGKADHLIEGGFWGMHMPGETAILELYSSVAVPAGAVATDRFVHGFPNALRDNNPWESKSLCGSDDSVNTKCVSDPLIYRQSTAVVRLYIDGDGYCTGWLVGSEGHLMTNRHCIKDATEAMNTDVEFMAEGSSCSSNCESIGACSNGTINEVPTFVAANYYRDYGLIKISSAYPALYGYLQVRDGDASVGDRIYIPQHPGAWGKRIAEASSHPENPDGYCEIDSTTEDGCHGLNNEYGYYCDTQSGSSGSPVIDRNDHCVIALHSCKGSDDCTSTGGDPNRAVPMPNIINHLGSNVLPDDAFCDQSVTNSGYTVGKVSIDEVIRTETISGFTDPVVIMGGLSNGGSDPSVVRVSNVTSTSFDYELQEWDYLNGIHQLEDAGYMVFESGRTNLGRRLPLSGLFMNAEAGKVTVDDSWTQVQLSVPMSGLYVVIATVGTKNSSNVVTTRLNNVNPGGFDVRLQAQESGSVTHSETVHWVAIEVGQSTINGNVFSVGTTTTDENWATLSFNTTVSPTAMVAGIQTFTGNDPAAVRYRSLSTTGAQVQVEEEESQDSETAHSNEIIGWVAFNYQ